MPTHTVSSVVTLLRHSKLLGEEELRQLETLQQQYPDPAHLVRAVLKKGWLTAYQALEIFSGRGKGLFLGDFVVLDRVGKGSTALVYKARHRPSGRTFALKVLRTDLLNPEEARDWLLRESQVGAKLSHPNILRTYGAFQIGTTLFLVMEFAKGCDLARLVGEHGPLPVNRACDYLRQASLGLQHAFERGIVHRDIKPSNLLLTEEDALIKVLDLGIAATHANGRTGAGVSAGTPDYVAPERIQSPAEADVRSDVYGLGCTLYHLLTGQPPFPGGTLEEKLVRHREEEPPPVEQLRPDVPAPLAEIVRQMMAKSPEDRFSTPALTADALAAFAEAGQCDTQYVLELEDEELSSLDPAQSTVVLPDQQAESNA